MDNKGKIFAKKLDTFFEEKSMSLCELDSNIGDGDHGITISRGFREANKEVENLDDDVSLYLVFKTIGYGMLSSMGGASGPIFSIFFIKTATLLRT